MQMAYWSMHMNNNQPMPKKLCHHQYKHFALWVGQHVKKYIKKSKAVHTKKKTIVTHLIKKTCKLVIVVFQVDCHAQNTFAERCELSACKQLFFSVRRPENSRCSASRCDNCCTSATSSLFACSCSSILCIADDNLDLALVRQWNNEIIQPVNWN